MKKKNLKSLNLNKKSISALSTDKITGGTRNLQRPSTPQTDCITCIGETCMGTC